MWLIEADNRKVVIKFNEDIIIKYESLFLNTYSNINIFSKLLYIDENYKFIAYDYIEGYVGGLAFGVELLEKLIEVISNYRVIDIDNYGWIDSPSSWKEFLFDVVNEGEENIKSIKLDIKKDIILEAIDIISKYRFNKYLLHGDFGVHNFISKDKKINGIIDPTPIVGDRIYDILYAICSSPKFLNSLELEKIKSEITKLGYTEGIIEAYLRVILYTRIGTCIKYHKEDLKLYMELYHSYLK